MPVLSVHSSIQPPIFLVIRFRYSNVPLEGLRYPNLVLFQDSLRTAVPSAAYHHSLERCWFMSILRLKLDGTVIGLPLAARSERSTAVLLASTISLRSVRTAECRLEERSERGCRGRDDGDVDFNLGP